jgi:hypothetical protein
MAKLKITHTNNGVTTDKYVSPTIVDGAHIGGTGGLTSQAGNQIQPVVYITGGSQLTGSILAQKGSHKFQVTDGSLTGKCTLTNASTLTAGQMSIQVNTAVLTSASANAYVASGASTSAYVTGFTATGPVALAVGQVVTGTGATGTVTISAINSASNVTVAYTSQTFSNVAAGTFNTSVYASRITNKFVYDFGSDGSASSSIAGGYNPNKYRYRLATPDATFVQVASA